MTPKQQAFVYHYLQSYNAVDAAKKAGYEYVPEDCSRILRSKEVSKAIRDHFEELKESTFYNEAAVIQNLWKEAMDTSRGASHAARITALVWLGKHIGMWQDRIKDIATDKKVVYNIVNYNTIKEEIDKNKEEVEKVKDTIESGIPDGIEVLDYSKSLQ